MGGGAALTAEERPPDPQAGPGALATGTGGAGGAAQAAAELAETAFASMAAVADRKAALARQCQSEDENTPPPEQHASLVKSRRFVFPCWKFPICF